MMPFDEHVALFDARQHDRAHTRSAPHIAGATLIAQGVWYGRLGTPDHHAPMYTHLWHVGPDRFVCDDDWRTGHQRMAHRADTAREIYVLLPEQLAPFPKERKRRVR